MKGWSWTPGTASWVEPTCYALIALRHISKELHPRQAPERMRLAEKMLFDRVCARGGWNSGNPLIYDVAGIPRVGPTAWALMALLSFYDHPVIHESLGWLEQSFHHIRGPASLSLAHLCLASYGRPVPALEPALAALNLNNHFFHEILVTAWAAIALTGQPQWLRHSAGASVSP